MGGLHRSECTMTLITRTLIIICLHHCTLYTAVLAEFQVKPLWNTSHDCLNKTAGEEMVEIQGSPTELCHLQLISSTQSAITISIHLTEMTDDFVIYIERIGDIAYCQNKYLVIKSSSLHSCDSTFVHPDLEVWIHGGIKVTISEKPRIDQLSLNSCPENANSKVSQKSICNIEGYNYMTTCKIKNKYVFWDSSFSDDPIVCRIDLPKMCISVFGDRVVYVQCPEVQFSQQNKEVAIWYPADINVVDLTFNSIATIQPNAFRGLDHIRVLSLTHNKLSYLDEGVFNNLKYLNYIDLAYNVIETLSVHTFRSLPNLVHLDIDYNMLVTAQVGLFHHLFHLTQLDLQFNQLVILDAHLFRDLSNLTYIDLDNNELVALHPNIFKGLYKLEYLHLDYNHLDSLNAYIFSDLYNLIYLDLKANMFVSLESSLFYNLHNLKTLLLGENKLHKLDQNLLQGTKSLQFLDLSDNNLYVIPNIKKLTHLSYLRLNDNPLTLVNNNSFVGIPITVEFYVSQPEICSCYTPQQLNCTAAVPQSPYLTCQRLLNDKVLAAFMWLIGINAIGGNIFVICWQNKNTNKNKIQSLLISNLAASDLLVGIYMIVIASTDIYFGAQFPMQAEIWRRGTTCKIVGTLAILASEASVFFVTLISIDRFMDIKFPYFKKTLKKKIIYPSIVLIWVFSTTIGIIPSFLAGKNLDFYDNSHVCIGLPLALLEKFSIKEYQTEICPANTPFCHTKTTTKSTSHGFDSGLYFSTAVFLGLNCLCYLIILICYIDIIRSVYKSSKRAKLNKEMKEQIKLTMKVAVIVATDFLCWFPIIILGILVQAKVLTLPASVFAWSVTVILPINSAINPYIYTGAVILSKRRKNAVAPQTNDTLNRSQMQPKIDTQTDNQMGQSPSMLSTSMSQENN